MVVNEYISTPDTGYFFMPSCLVVKDAYWLGSCNAAKA